MKKILGILVLKIVLRFFNIHDATNLLKDAYYGSGFTEAIKLAHRNLLQGKEVTFSKKFEKFQNISPEMLEIKLFAKRKNVKIKFIKD